MKYYFYAFILIFLSSCKTVHMTGRQQINFVSNEEVLPVAAQQYDKVIEQAQISKNQIELQRLERVGSRIAATVDQYLKEHNLENHFDWQFELIDDPQINAWCMPGGKIAVYTGILAVTKDDTGLAVVLGHEVAHAIAEHGNERISMGMLQNLGLLALGIGLESQEEVDKEIGQAILLGAGVLANVGLTLPFSRHAELEADYMGLMIMAQAGYNPEEAVDFWRRMAENAKGSKPPEFLSTHPNDTNRTKRIKEYLPKAKLEYEISIKAHLQESP